MGLAALRLGGGIAKVSRGRTGELKLLYKLVQAGAIDTQVPANLNLFPTMAAVVLLRADSWSTCPSFCLNNFIL